MSATVNELELPQIRLKWRQSAKSRRALTFVHKVVVDLTSVLLVASPEVTVTAS